jgi:hypothetical protein
LFAGALFSAAWDAPSDTLGLRFPMEELMNINDAGPTLKQSYCDVLLFSIPTTQAFLLLG